MKDMRHKIVHVVWFYWYGIHYKAKLICISRNQMAGFLCGGNKKGFIHRGLFLGNGYVLFQDGRIVMPGNNYQKLNKHTLKMNGFSFM